MDILIISPFNLFSFHLKWRSKNEKDSKSIFGRPDTVYTRILISPYTQNVII